MRQWPCPRGGLGSSLAFNVVYKDRNVRGTLEISKRPSEERSYNVSNGINRIHNTRCRRSVVDIEAEILAVLAIAVDRAHQGAIVSVDAGVERCYHDAPVQLFPLEESATVADRQVGKQELPSSSAS